MATAPPIPPPPGFTLDPFPRSRRTDDDDLPPPPPGFVLDAAPPALPAPGKVAGQPPALNPPKGSLGQKSGGIMGKNPAPQRAIVRVPEMRGGVPLGTKIEIGFNEAEGPFDIEGWYQKTYGISRNQAAQVEGVLNANLDNRGITAQQLGETFKRLGIPTGKIDLERAAGQINAGDFIGETPKHDRFNFDWQSAEDRRKLELDMEIQRRGVDPESVGRAALGHGLQGAAWGGGDEISGALAGMIAATKLQNPVTAYQDERDLTRRKLERSAAYAPKTAIASEIAGGLTSGPLGFRKAGAATVEAMAAKAAARELGSVQALEAARQAARNALNVTAISGAKTGAIAGFNYGEGPGGSAKGAVAGAALGVPVAVGIQSAAPMIAKGFGAVADRLRANRLAAPQMDIPPPPPGYTIDPPQLGDDASGIGPGALPVPQRAQPMSQPLDDVRLQSIAQDVRPSDMLPMPSNVVEDAAEAANIDAGRVVPAKPVNERGELGKRTVKAWNGRQVPKVGPVDLLGWVRTQGGLQDVPALGSKGGDLAAMGLSNAPRRGVDFAGNENQFGPLINNENGMSLDDAALKAWEAGYFPDHTERPSINEFLEAIDQTARGSNRRFLPEDLAEVDRYYGAQSERIDLEKQLAEGPVYQDRSVPADDGQPFAPPQAYEEWGGTAQDYAGNINLNKLDTPQDINRALVQTERRVGFDAATRGRVTQAETERLASELGMTANDLLARRKGQAFNAEEALAARQILAKSGNELVNAARRVQRLENPGDEVLADFRQKWLRHAAIQEQVAGATAEAGRTLGQFRMAAHSSAVRGDVLGAIVRGGGGPDRLRDAAETLLEAVETAPGKFNTTARDLTKSTWRHRIAEYYINALLSGPQTHVVNTVSNTLTAIGQIPEYALGTTIGRARQMFSKAPVDRITESELGARTFGLLQGAKEGAKMFSEALGVMPGIRAARSAYRSTGSIKEGAQAFERAFREAGPSDFVSKVEGDQYRAIPGRLGEAIRIPTRFLSAEDEFFKGIARRMELNAQAVRVVKREGLTGAAAKARLADLVANPTDEMIEQAMEYGRYLTFQRQLGPVASKVSAVTNESLTAKLFLPFVRTPTNLVKFAAERSPAAPLLKEWRQDFLAGGARRDMAIARASIGTGLGIAVYELALEGKITGAAPSDPRKARLLYADGWQPYSIKIGDSWYSYKRLDPFSTTIGVAADMATMQDGMTEKQRENKATLVVASIMGNLADKTWLSGVSDLVAALDEPDRYADRMMQRLVSSFLVPTGVAQVARTNDPTRREVESLGDALQARIPGLSDNLAPRRDVWGRPIVNQGGFGPDFLSPAWVSKQMDDPVNSELLKIGYAPGYVSQKVGGRELSPKEFDRYQERAGGLSYERLRSLVTAPAWQSISYDDKMALAKRTVAAARDEVRKDLFGDGDKSPGRLNQAAPLGEAGGRNVYADLQREIPGAGLTSGYRTPEYQAKMRQRGYSPASNSAHLSGSSLDITPPSGMSMAELMRRLKRYDSTAQLIDEGDHVHATFPGYFGAPPLGGAKGAGVTNPYAGMPPPPPGFTMDR